MSEEKTGLSKFISELRNRRVFRVAAVYLGIGFAVLEASDIIIPMLGLPEILALIILGILMIGFPIATTLSWHYQLTEEGLRRSPKTGEKHTADHKPFTSNTIITVLLIVIIGLLAYPRFAGEVSNSEATSAETAVNLLPFYPSHLLLMNGRTRSSLMECMMIYSPNSPRFVLSKSFPEPQ